MFPSNVPTTARCVPAAFKAQSTGRSSPVSDSTTKYHNRLPAGLYFEITDEFIASTFTLFVTAGSGSTSAVPLPVRK